MFCIGVLDFACSFTNLCVVLTIKLMVASWYVQNFFHGTDL